MSKEISFEESARKCCHKYEVQGPAREAFLALGAALDAKPAAFELIVLSRAYDEFYKAVEEVYRPRTPLEAQLEHIRARKDYLAATGIDLGEWDGNAMPVDTSVDTSEPDTE